MRRETTPTVDKEIFKRTASSSKSINLGANSKFLMAEASF